MLLQLHLCTVTVFTQKFCLYYSLPLCLLSVAFFFSSMGKLLGAKAKQSTNDFGSGTRNGARRARNTSYGLFCTDQKQKSISSSEKVVLSYFQDKPFYFPHSSTKSVSKMSHFVASAAELSVVHIEMINGSVKSSFNI